MIYQNGQLFIQVNSLPSQVPAAVVTLSWDEAVLADIAAAGGGQKMSELNPDLLENIMILSWIKSPELSYLFLTILIFFVSLTVISPRVLAHMKTELPNVLQYCTNKIEASHNMVVGKEELYIIIYIKDC